MTTEKGNIYLIRWRRKMCDNTRMRTKTNFYWGESPHSCTTKSGEFRACVDCQYNTNTKNHSFYSPFGDLSNPF